MHVSKSVQNRPSKCKPLAVVYTSLFYVLQSRSHQIWNGQSTSGCVSSFVPIDFVTLAKFHCSQLLLIMALIELQSGRTDLAKKRLETNPAGMQE